MAQFHGTTLIDFGYGLYGVYLTGFKDIGYLEHRTMKCKGPLRT